MQDLEKDAFWRAKVSNLMRGAVQAVPLVKGGPRNCSF
jgi:hypothetical protein